MSLPFTNLPELENGFAPLQTPVRNRTFASTSTWNPETVIPPPPRKEKGKMSADRLREPMEEEIEDVSDTDTPQGPNLPPQPQPQPQGYGLHNMGRAEEPVERRYGPRIIKEPGLFYNGEHFMKFLKRFEIAAEIYQATDYDKALQIGRFVQTEELKSELEAMDGYEKRNWRKLRKEMVSTWGELDNTILYTTADLIKVAEDFSKEGRLKDYREYKMYLGKFSSILKYLVENEHINKKQDASLLFLSAFSPESQKNIKRSLVSQGRLPKGKDGSNRNHTA